MNAWAYRDIADVSFLIAIPVALVALLYYFAATQVFPKATDKDSLDNHIMEHRRVVVFCVLTSNLITQIPPAISAYTTPWPLADVALWAGLNLSYYLLLTTAALAKSKIVVSLTVASAITLVTGATAIFA
jgi:hypothetical protein